jgi:hypothetical protein
MRTAAFIAMLIGIGLMILAASNGGPQCASDTCAGVVVGWLLGLGLFWISALMWIRLTILGWLIRFGARNWYQGRDQYFDEDSGRKL